MPITRKRKAVQDRGQELQTIPKKWVRTRGNPVSHDDSHNDVHEEKVDSISEDNDEEYEEGQDEEEDDDKDENVDVEEEEDDYKDEKRVSLSKVKHHRTRNSLLKTPNIDDYGVSYSGDDEDVDKIGRTCIRPETMNFLSELASNNDRDWFNAHHDIYKEALKDFENLVEQVGTRLMARDSTIPELPLKDLVFRIYRDIRFSNDQTPYKTWTDIHRDILRCSMPPGELYLVHNTKLASPCTLYLQFFRVCQHTLTRVLRSRTGRKGSYAHYYLSLQPNASFVGGGMWHPESQALGRIRKAIDKKPQDLKTILTAKTFSSTFLSANEQGKGAEAPVSMKKHGSGKQSGDYTEILRRFVKRNEENALKTAPKGYPKDHEDIELLKLKDFTVGKKLSNDDLLHNDAASTIADIFTEMVPFVSVAISPEYDSLFF